MQAVQFLPIDSTRDSECVICLNTKEDNVWVAHDAESTQENVKVQHIFHKSCLGNVLKQSSNHCPLCRKEVRLVGVLEDSEIEELNQQDPVMRGLDRWYCGVTHLGGVINSLLLLLLQITFEDRTGKSIEGNLSCLAIGIITALNLYNSSQRGAAFIGKREVTALNAGFSALALSTLNLINPLFSLQLGMKTVMEEKMSKMLLYAIVIGGLAKFWSPAKIHVMNRQERIVGVRYRMYGACYMLPIAALIARSAWNYYHS